MGFGASPAPEDEGSHIAPAHGAAQLEASSATMLPYAPYMLQSVNWAGPAICDYCKPLLGVQAREQDYPLRSIRDTGVRLDGGAEDAISLSPPRYFKLLLRAGDHSAWFSQPSPLICRGWTLQESVLSRRIVLYTGAELAWDLPDKDEDMGGWMRLVQLYAARELTNVSDKLVAISGIAKSIDVAGPLDTGDDDGSFYLAGLFRAHLTQQLLWSSWASMDGDISYAPCLELDEEPHVTIHHDETHCEAVVPGEPTGALVTVKRTWARVPDTIVRWPGGARKSVSLDEQRPVDIYGETGSGCWNSDYHDTCDKCAAPAESDKPGEQRYWGLKVATYTDSAARSSMFFLILERAEEADGQGAWRRVGLGEVNSDWQTGKVSPWKVIGGDLFDGARRSKIRIV
ncbi:hypothetical protein B0T24DRAFT_721220 [Lasiosphaeria ovina]|uniref:Heterokaryon incompatibility protein n=1 Tax=Lasiosphaeria ovina TaxID=92902 RepID=A0AAE0K6C4_9PEZI|nr:hypothetical protein B0T24DRAFT_721220 [Lasiosphaeria ovina]